ncbi:MAG: family 20 glycosylhydrolase [Actinomycetaceae bacterium]|nr:family 20 glycosylhydrolase [Actinomycetaceae bacterium]
MRTKVSKLAVVLTGMVVLAAAMGIYVYSRDSEGDPRPASETPMQSTAENTQSNQQETPRETIMPTKPAVAHHWRGVMIDVARNFLGVDDVIELMDLAQSLQLNRFHMHLSDDQGWRLEIPGWPKLTERSGGTSVAGANCGYYTVSEWRRLVRAAAARDLIIVPEIDLPGHTNAALHAIEGLNIDGVRPEPYTGMQVGHSSLHLAAPETERFVKEILSFVARESHGYVHIGGDEADATSREEYAAIVSMAVDIVHRSGAKVVAWQEAAPFLSEGDLIQLWDDRQDYAPIAEATQRGAQVILSPAYYVYFDMKYSDAEVMGTTWNRRIEIQDTAAWDPLADLGPIPAEAVIGVEAALWSETLRTRADYEYMLLPRLAAFSEIAMNGPLDWEEFAEELPDLARSWDNKGWNWHASPGVDWD